MHPATGGDSAMTGTAKRALLGNEQMGVGGTVRRMAGEAAAFGDGRVGVGFTGDNGGMAGFAEPGVGFFQDKGGG